MVNATIRMDKTNNGIPVITERIEGRGTAGVMIAVNTGSRDETKDIWGISHLLEHSVFRATDNRTSIQLAQEIEGAGGTMNAATSREITAYHATTLKSTVDVAKSVIADIVCNPLLMKDHVDMEKQIVLQEIALYENDPSAYIHDLFAETMWRDHPLAHNEAGTVETVNGMNAEDLMRYYLERYTQSNVSVYACGDVDPEDIVTWAEENLEDLPVGEPNRRDAPKVNRGTYAHYLRKEDQCYIGMGFPAYPADHPYRTAQSILSTIIGSGASSRMFCRVREEKALVYSIYNDTAQMTDSSTMGTFFSTSEDNVLEAIETAGKVYRSILKEGVGQTELEKAKNLSKGALIRSMERTDNRMYKLMAGTMLTGEPISLEERLRRVDEVNCDDLAHVAEELIRSDLLTVVMYGKKIKSMKKFDPAQIDL